MGRINVTLPPYQQRVVEAIAEFNGQSMSSVIADAVKNKIDSIPMKDKERILRVTEK
jgi:hypothetical protein